MQQEDEADRGNHMEEVRKVDHGLQVPLWKHSEQLAWLS